MSTSYYFVKIRSNEIEKAQKVLQKFSSWCHSRGTGWLHPDYHSAIHGSLEMFEKKWKGIVGSGPVGDYYFTFGVTNSLVSEAYSGSILPNKNSSPEVTFEQLVKAKTLASALKIKVIKHRGAKKKLEEVLSCLKECQNLIRSHVATNSLSPHSDFVRVFEKSRDVIAKYDTNEKGK